MRARERAMARSQISRCSPNNPTVVRARVRAHTCGTLNLSQDYGLALIHCCWQLEFQGDKKLADRPLQYNDLVPVLDILHTYIATMDNCHYT